MSATHLFPYRAPGKLCRGVCVKQPQEPNAVLLEKSECWMWIMFTGTSVICQSLFCRKQSRSPGYLTCPGSKAEEKGILQARNKECGLQKVILDLLSHVCAACPRRGDSLTAIAPLVSVRIRTPLESVRCLAFASPVVKDNEERKSNLEKKSYGSACRLVRIVLPLMPMVS